VTRRPAKRTAIDCSLKGGNWEWVDYRMRSVSWSQLSRPRHTMLGQRRVESKRLVSNENKRGGRTLGISRVKAIRGKGYIGGV